jgi:hypothetical protein
MPASRAASLTPPFLPRPPVLPRGDQAAEKIRAAVWVLRRDALGCLHEIRIGIRFQMNEQRRELRHRVYKAATIEFGSSTIPCLVRNVSASGATIEVNTPLWFPDHFTLGIPSDGRRHPCRIVWRSDKRIGLQFEE